MGRTLSNDRWALQIDKRVANNTQLDPAPPYGWTRAVPPAWTGSHDSQTEPMERVSALERGLALGQGQGRRMEFSEAQAPHIGSGSIFRASQFLQGVIEEGQDMFHRMRVQAMVEREEQSLQKELGVDSELRGAIRPKSASPSVRLTTDIRP